MRELRNAVERAVILARPGSQVRAEHLAFIPRDQAGDVVLGVSERQVYRLIEKYRAE